MEEPETRPAVVPPEQPEEKSFIASLFDFSFTSFVTPSLTKVLYLIGLGWAVYFVVAFVLNGGFTGFFWRICLSPVLLVIGVILVRAAVEIIMVAFRIFELLKRIDERQRREQRESAPKA